MFDLSEVLKGVKTVGISGHENPDGDCVGSCLGLYLFLTTYYPELKVRVHLGLLPDDLTFMQGADLVDHTQDVAEPYDLFFCLDCAETGRLGDNAVLFEQAKKTACIDHHISKGTFADVRYIDSNASSTCELVCLVLGTEKLTPSMAEALYTGIVHDTGVFQYSCTSSRTMRIAGELMDKGIDFSKIIEETFYAKTYHQMQITGRAMLESIMLLDGRVVFSALRQKDLDFYGVDNRDLGGIVAQLRSISGVDVAIFLYEKGLQEWKVSLRSNDCVDVAEVASYFGGGGHKKAAGCTMQGSVYDVVNNLTAHIEHSLEEWDKEHGKA